MGQIALVAGAVIAMFSVVCALIKPDWERPSLAAGLGLLWLAVAHLVVVLIEEDTSYVIVVEHTRPGLDPFGRVMGLWGGSEGSLLLFTVIVGSVLASAPVQRPMAIARPLVVATMAWATVLAATPFEQLTNPAIAGSGLSPILEHWAMLVHPPLLYIGLALSLVPAAVDPRVRRPWTAAAIAVLTAALALGGGWAYVELGWGGWWAWDPVENAALIPWLLLAATLHLQPDHRATHWSLLVVWPTVFAGTAMTRTSLRTSVHAFADNEALGWFLWPLTFGVGALALLHRRNHPATSRDPAPWRTLAPVAVLLSTAVVVAIGTFRPFVPGDATDGSFYTRFLFPVVIVGLVALGVAPRIPVTSSRRLVGEVSLGAAVGILVGTAVGWSTWWQLLLAGALSAGFTTTVGGGLRPTARTFAHLGMLCVVAGALGGTASVTQTFSLEQGASAEIEGSLIVNRGIELDSLEQPVLRATIEVDGRVVEPSLTIYPERALRLPEVATVRRPLEDIQVILRSADDSGTVTLTVNVEPLTQFVWSGAVLILVSMVALSTPRSGAPAARRSVQGHDVSHPVSHDETEATR